LRNSFSWNGTGFHAELEVSNRQSDRLPAAFSGAAALGLQPAYLRPVTGVVVDDPAGIRFQGYPGFGLNVGATGLRGDARGRRQYSCDHAGHQDNRKLVKTGHNLSMVPRGGDKGNESKVFRLVDCAT